ncbi:MAG: hypothetical protein KKC46_05010 [Proteobacteria bacterium]|nr:hypothetical protein [Pseudomonadota bacterium]
MHRKRRYFYFIAIASILLMFSAEVMAETTFHGYFESNFVLRDTTGIQNGFFEEAEGVQQRNTLKFDVDVYPDSMEIGPFSVSKVHLTFRGAYDSIFDLRANEYDDNIRDNMGLSRFDYGKRDIKFESDLREAFVDFVYSGSLGSAFFRPGRQLVSWGEASGNTTILDVINPKDQSYQMFFQNPDDVKIPIYMARLNYGLPEMKGLNINFDFLWIPDIRPSQFGPLDSVAGQPSVGINAPYVKILPFTAFRGRNVKQHVPTNESEYGAKVTADIGARLSVSAAYFRDINNDSGFVYNPADTTMYGTHNVQHVYGMYFSYNLTELDLVIRGEIGHHTGDVISKRNGMEASREIAGGFDTFAIKPTTRYTLMLDKKYKIPFITDHERTSFGFEWIHEKINEWDKAVLDRSGVLKTGSSMKDLDIFAFSMMWSWYEGRVGPLIAVSCNPGRPGAGGASWMIHPVVNWQISNNLYANFGLHAFLGDKTAKTGYSGLVPTSEFTVKLGYNW